MSKALKQTIGFLALYGLLSEIVFPTRPEMLADAERIIFSSSIEIRQLASLLNTDAATLQAEIKAFLKAEGVNIEKYNFH